MKGSVENGRLVPGFRLVFVSFSFFLAGGGGGGGIVR
jgi:hypothetical protein